MDTNNKKEKPTKREKGKVGGREQQHLDRLGERRAGTGETGRTGKQTMF